MGEMGALLKLGHASSENVVEKGDGTLAWAAMLLKNHRNHPVKKRARVGWSLTILPAFVLLHACQIPWAHCSLAWPCQPWTSTQISVPLGSEICECLLCEQLGLPELQVDCLWEAAWLVLRGCNRSRGFDIFNQKIPESIVQPNFPGTPCAPGNMSADGVQRCLARLFRTRELLATKMPCTW